VPCSALPRDVKSKDKLSAISLKRIPGFSHKNVNTAIHSIAATFTKKKDIHGA
jgi:hypothetical protein